MPLILSEAVDADFDRLVQILFAAFGQTGDAPREAYIDVVYPGGDTPSGQAAARDKILTWLHADPTATFLKVTDTTTGEIVAAAKWIIFMEKPDSERPPIHVDWCEGEDKDYTEWVMDLLFRSRFERTAPKGPYLCELLRSVEFLFCGLKSIALHSVLDIIFTDPKHQHRGAGSKLVKWGVDRADEMGVEVFLESTRYARHMYEQHGFKLKEQVVWETPEKWSKWPTLVHWFMWRPAVKKVVV